MSSRPRFAAPNRSWIRRLLGAAIAGTVFGSSAVLTTIPARADSAVSVKSASFTIRGAGWGHGWGMSQYGAYGAARKGPVLEANPCFLLSRHSAQDHAQRHQDQGLDYR